MFEALVVAAATTGLFVVAKGFRGSERLGAVGKLAAARPDEKAEDLPCPWCYAPTHESDRRCGGCGRAFG